MGIAVLTMAGVVYGYAVSCKRAEWSAYSLAAQSLAIQRMEQARACKWDLQASPTVDELVACNFPVVTNIMDVPMAGTNLTLGVCKTVITQVSAAPPLKSIQVDCTWSFLNGRKFTNTVLTYRGPDN